MIDLAEFYKNQAILLIANKLHADYSEVVQKHGRIEPERYQEMWLDLHIIGDEDHTFKDGICSAFISMLQKSDRKNS